ncbi:MAG: GTPase ObgE [Ureaplasma sp.]|nr:GTPase ObgE [Ureaplasma sp.]
MAFIDKCKILIKAGNGGNGIVSWRREAHVPLGGPAGGNGGNGGNIYFIGNKNETSLESIAYRKKIVAESGINGGIKNMYGRNGEHTYINVPLGTVVIDEKTGKIIADILVEKKEYLIAEGGIGGHGNAFFKSGFNKAPTLYELGEKGEEINAIIELKQISDIGLIGLPNAGKSSLISCLTNAKPKIADYQFTTLIPILGVLEYKQNKILIADIPGLVEGASKGVGLGYDFLRHIERCKILVHVISLSKSDNEDITKSINIINNELKSYDINLINKKIIIVANKSDEDLDGLQFKKIKSIFKNTKIIKTSCLTDLGLDELKEELINTYLDQSSETSDDEIIEWKESIPKSDKLSKEIKIEKLEEHIFKVNCEYLEYWAYRIPINTSDNLIRLNQKITSTSMLKDLSNMGAKEGDTIILGDTKLYYEN